MLPDDASASDERRWLAVSSRDATADGDFVYAVRTTGVFCRPGCPSRLPRRENVAFFDSPENALAHGYRACRKCRPLSPEARGLPEAVRATVAALRDAETTPSLGELAQAAGVSPGHLQRLFKKTLGVSPKKYALALRSQRLQDGLLRERTVTEAVYAAGYGSSSRCYAQTRDVLGMRPKAYKRGGSGQSIRFAVERCSLGWVVVAATDAGVCLIELGDSPERLRESIQVRFPNALASQDANMGEMVRKVLQLVETPGASAQDIPLDVRGTVFQRKVWDALRSIPPGSTATYAEVARMVGKPEAVRAVGGALAANLLAVAVPCHRVIKSDGSLSGYRWGTWRKAELVERERQAAQERRQEDA